MAPIRILVVDDSVVIRKLLCDTLSKDPELEAVASAGDGRIALAKISQLHPDLITLDVEMPVMNGLEALAEVRKRPRRAHRGAPRTRKRQPSNWWKPPPNSAVWSSNSRSTRAKTAAGTAPR